MVLYDIQSVGSPQSFLSSKALVGLLKRGFWIGLILLVISTLAVVAKAITRGQGVNWIYAVIAAASLVLLIYTLFFALPFQATYLTQNQRRVYNEGLYALCRHPGVLWFSVFYCSLSLAFKSIDLGVFSAVVILENILYVMLQDWWTFPRFFVDYGAYQRSTPFLIPNPTSIKRCLSTMFNRHPVR